MTRSTRKMITRTVAALALGFVVLAVATDAIAASDPEPIPIDYPLTYGCDAEGEPDCPPPPVTTPSDPCDAGDCVELPATGRNATTAILALISLLAGFGCTIAARRSFLQVTEGN